MNAKSKKEEIVEEDVKEEEEEAVLDDEIGRNRDPQQSDYDQEIDLKAVERSVDVEEDIAPEVDAIHSDNLTSKEANKSKAKKSSKNTKKVKVKKTDKQRSKNYQNALTDIDRNKAYAIEEAVELTKKISYAKFDSTITIDIKLSRPKKGDESVRGTIKLPHPIDKKTKVAIASEDLIEEISKGKMDFDVILATPEMMPKLAKVAKILGPKGKMPNPKDGTVTDDPEKTVKELSSVARYKADAGYNLHVPVGKLSDKTSDIVENIEAVLSALTKYKKETVVVSATMTPGLKLEI